MMCVYICRPKICRAYSVMMKYNIKRIDSLMEA